MHPSPDGPTPDDHEQGKTQAQPPLEEPVWTYRGYRLRASEFTTAMVHLFRAEVQRANVWRQRLDTTTNWAVITTGAAVSFAFTQSDSSHLVIPLNILLVTLFLSIEARRYRYYELWSYRIRLMETDFFAAMLVPPFHPAPDWAEALSEHLLHPHFSISALEAIGRRLRRNYLWIYAIITFAWMAKLWLLPFPADSVQQMIVRARVGLISGQVVFLLVMGFIGILVFISLATIGLQGASGEVLPRFGVFAAGKDKSGSTVRAWFRPSARRKQLLTLIITDRADLVGERILKDMGRGVTALSGTGMYTHAQHTVLMCALTLTEIPQLRHLISQVDPNAFVVVSPAQEIFGKGFMPLETDT